MLTVVGRGGACHHVVIPKGNYRVEDEGLRRDGRRHQVREGLNVPGGNIRVDVDHLEHGEDAVLGAGTRCPGMSRRELEVRLPLGQDVCGYLWCVAFTEKAHNHRVGGSGRSRAIGVVMCSTTI